MEGGTESGMPAASGVWCFQAQKACSRAWPTARRASAFTQLWKSEARESLQALMAYEQYGGILIKNLHGSLTVTDKK